MLPVGRWCPLSTVMAQRKPRTISGPPALEVYEYAAPPATTPPVGTSTDAALSVADIPPLESLSPADRVRPEDAFEGLSEAELEARMEALARRLETRATAIKCRSDVGPTEPGYSAVGEAIYQSWRDGNDKQSGGNSSALVVKSSPTRAADIVAFRVAEFAAVETYIHQLLRTHLLAAVFADVAERQRRVAEEHEAAVERHLDEEAARRQRLRDEERTRQDSKKHADQEFYLSSSDPFIAQLRKDAQQRIALSDAAAAQAMEDEIERLNAKLAKFAASAEPPQGGDDGQAVATVPASLEAADVSTAGLAQVDHAARSRKPLDFDAADALDDATHEARRAELEERRKRVVSSCIDAAKTTHVLRGVSVGASEERLAELRRKLAEVDAEGSASTRPPPAQDTSPLMVAALKDAKAEAKQTTSKPAHQRSSFVTSATLD
jgi:hypothetical protein